MPSCILLLGFFSSRFCYHQITVEQDAIDHVQGVYINPSHPIFDLVPPNLNDYIQLCYEEIGCPIIDHDSAWTVYHDLLDKLQHGNNSMLLDVSGDEYSDEELEDLPLLNKHQDLPFNEDGYYMGGVGSGLGLGKTPHDSPFNTLN
jgi:hypothetical protein